jgi:hypothetical protein
MSPIVIKSAVHEPASGHLTGIQFVYELGCAKGWVSIQGMQPISHPDILSAYQAAILSLAQELLETAQNPQSISEARLPLGKPSNSQE